MRNRLRDYFSSHLTKIQAVAYILFIVLAVLIIRVISITMENTGDSAGIAVPMDQILLPVGLIVVAAVLAAVLGILITRLQIRSAAMERELHAAQQALRLTQYAIDHSRDSAHWINAEGHFVYVNDAMCQELGYTREELANITVYDIDTSFTKESWAEHWERSRGFAPDTIEAVHRRKDGSLVPVEIATSYLMFEGGEYHIAFARNISERKKVENALRLASYALEKVADAVYWIQEDGRIVDVNQAAVQMLGYSRDELVTMWLSDIDHSITPAIWRNNWKNLKANSSRRFEREHTAKDGRIITVEVVANFIQYGDQILDCALTREITRLKESQSYIAQLNEDLEQRVTDRTAQLEATNKELEAFAYSVSHDLRAPLRAVDGYTQILIEDYGELLDEEGRRVCSIICDETRRMGQLIDALLTFSRVGRAEIQMVTVDMQQMVESVFQEITARENPDRIAFQPGALYPVVCDSALLRQVWQNLLGNAVKFSRYRDKAVIKVKSSKVDGEVIYSISDNGAGFDMQYAGNLFGVFQRLHSEREFEGSGVGLAIAQRIIQRHGGRIWAESQVDQGATIYFTLPNKGEAL